uniref:Uncharacterized protein n=1 Tax=Zea mays TaxID=4577 RepID=A0A804NG20_MAIZE
AHSTAPRNGGQAAAPAAATPAPPRRGRRVVATARRRRRGHGHWHARPPAQAREAAQQHAARGRAARPAWWRSRHWHGVVQPVPGQLGVRRHAADVRRGGVPLRGAGVRLPEVWPARQAVPQVPVAPGVLRAPEVQRAGLAEAVEGEEDTVRGGLHQPEPVGVACVHAARGRAGVLQGRLRQGQPRLQRHVPGLRGVGGLLPEHLPGGHRRGVRRPGAQARLHHRRRVARRRRPRLQHVALVDAHRQGPTVGLRPRRRAGDEGHGPAHGLLQGDVHMGQVGRLQRRHLQDQGLLPGHLADPLQRSRLGRGLAELRAADAAGPRAGVPRRPRPGAGRRAGRPPLGLQRRPPGQRLQPLVPRRRAGHVEPDPLRVAPPGIGPGREKKPHTVYQLAQAIDISYLKIGDLIVSFSFFFLENQCYVIYQHIRSSSKRVYNVL